MKERGKKTETERESSEGDVEETQGAPVRQAELSPAVPLSVQEQRQHYRAQGLA